MMVRAAPARTRRNWAADRAGFDVIHRPRVPRLGRQFTGERRLERTDPGGVAIESAIIAARKSIDNFRKRFHARRVKSPISRRSMEPSDAKPPGRLEIRRSASSGGIGVNRQPSSCRTRRHLAPASLPPSTQRQDLASQSAPLNPCSKSGNTLAIVTASPTLPSWHSIR